MFEDFQNGLNVLDDVELWRPNGWTFQVLSLLPSVYFNTCGCLRQCLGELSYGEYTNARGIKPTSVSDYVVIAEHQYMLLNEVNLQSCPIAQRPTAALCTLLGLCTLEIGPSRSARIPK